MDVAAFFEVDARSLRQWNGDYDCGYMEEQTIYTITDFCRQ